jgi:type VI secretion system protein ImpI
MIDEILIRVALSSERSIAARELPDPDPFDDEIPMPQLAENPASEYIPRDTIPERANVSGFRSPMEDNISLPDPVPVPNIPEDWLRDDTLEAAALQRAGSPAAINREKVYSPPAARIREQLPDLQAFLKGAGIDGATLTPEVLSTLGSILRITVGGVVEMLRARKEIRRVFRVETTIAQGPETNPLKVSTDASDALHNIFVKHNAVFLPAVAAFEEAFDDLRCHQMAMLVGMRAGFAHMLKRFNPDKLEHRFESQAKLVAFKGLAGRSKLWEQYRLWFEEAIEDDDDSFRRFFGDEFAKAYEEEMGRLLQSRRQRRKSE